MSATVYDQHAQFYLSFVDRALTDDRSIWFQHLALYQQILNGRLAGARVLDLACGEGYLSRFLAELDAREVVGIDLSAVLVAAALERTNAGNVSYRIDDAQHLRTVTDRSFDIAVCQMALMDIPDHRALFRSVRRVLTPTGMFVFSLLHPCFEAPFHLPEAPPLLDVAGSTQAVVVRRYRTEGFWQSGGTGVRGHMGAYHRTLSTLLNDLRVAGFHLEQLEEPVADEYGLFAEVPRTMVIAVQAS